ncbi:penicillin-binding protein [Streptomyces sp. SID5785]|uniref:penicillin-binding transpeptidase domain-containing protein n=1 Tax=Streptomyces sp. SID5785 TaxID=2690309 RepID=UPI00136195D0|nr:penicillin-binding transpeptidase domain-containing protein [Streptomyces sp. SID5785]MZD09963.1 penicillin-binding protein [Streptomyces sp. SID5785]
MRKGVKVAIVGGVFTVMVGGAGYGAYNIVTAVTGTGGSSAAGPAAHRTGPPTADEVREASGHFLTAWAKNDADTAAGYTNYAEHARAALRGWHEDAHVTHTVLKAGKPADDRVPFTVKATVEFDGKKKTLSYASSLTVVRGESTGRALVRWRPSVLHPDLKDGDTLVTGESKTPPIEAVDRNGTVLTAKKYPSLGPVLDQLRAKYGDKAGGSPGVETYIQRTTADGTETAGTLLTLAEGRPGTLRTTLSASAQAAAERAVTRYAQSSVVAVKASTGEVLAVANADKREFNAAFNGRVAPGSTLKILTSAALIDHGVTTANGPAPCPASAVAMSQTFHNLTGMAADEGATLSNSFARSCNTAFIKYSDDLGSQNFADEAQQRFGLGKDWKTGIVSFDGSVPAAGGPDAAAGMIGQGQVQMNPLNLASVTATATTGAFHQPVLVAQGLDDRTLATAQGLSSGTVAQLRAMMHLTATASYGTATRVMAGLGPDVGAKTGSAEVDGQGRSNSWFTGYRGDVTAAAMVLSGGHGGDAAGPIVAAVLRAGA